MAYEQYLLPHASIPTETRGRAKAVIHQDILGALEQPAMAIWQQTTPKGYGAPMHYHRCDEVIMFLEGSAEVVIEEERHTVQAPTTIYIPAGVLHGFRVTSDTPAKLLAIFSQNDTESLFPEDQTQNTSTKL